MKLSVIIPCHNEEGNVTSMHERLSEVLKSISYELLFIDDGSKDKTLEVLKSEYEKDKTHIKIITFSRNFGKEAAIFAGLCNSSGEFTCIIDGDLQQNPVYLAQMLNYLEQNKEYDQVAMIMEKRKKEGFFTEIAKSTFYKLIDRISDIHFESGASDFRMFRTNVKEAILSLGENNRFSKGIFSWVGFNTYYMPYEVELRTSGETKFNFKSNLRYAIDGILGFSIKPLKVATYFGIFSSIVAFVYTIIVLLQKIFGNSVPGYSSLMCVILFLGGIQLITIGILGEYLAKNYLETKKRPIYLSREEIGFKK